MRLTPEVLLLTGLVVAFIALGTWMVLRRMQGTPEKRERQRRQLVNSMGRLADAYITEANDTTIFYEYSVQGVHYTASQDISMLRGMIPVEPERLIGLANLKYTQRNPANSILICEEWSGLRPPTRVAVG